MPGSAGIGRRRFGGALAAAVLTAGAVQAAPQRAAPHRVGLRPRPLIKPPRLREGDLVGLVAPGGRTSDAGVDLAVRNIEALGLRVKLGANLRAVLGNYAGSVRERLDDLHAMFADPEVKAIWCVRGGSGCISLLAGLDYALIRAHPTILIGYSDITALHLAIHRRAGIVTFHGPVAGATLSDYSKEHLLAVLCDPQPRYTIPMAAENAVRARTAPQYALRTAHAGTATGPLIGGNLSMVSALAGTPYGADFRRAILFLEEVNEAPYRLDRWMTQLDLAVGLRHAAALMIGVCENCEGEADDAALSLEATLAIHLAHLAVPAVSGYSFGHIRDQFTLPIGVRATLDTDARTLTLLEAAVR